jgi:putative transposase
MTSDSSKIESVLDDLLTECDSPQDILGEHGLVKAFTTRVVERALQAE